MILVTETEPWLLMRSLSFCASEGVKHASPAKVTYSILSAVLKLTEKEKEMVKPTEVEAISGVKRYVGQRVELDTPSNRQATVADLTTGKD